MALPDDALDATSRQLLKELDEVKRLELDKRYEPRGTHEFSELAGQVEQRAKHVFELAHDQRLAGEGDSPVAADRQEHHAGDWTDGNRS
jgi:hypothetical protein